MSNHTQTPWVRVIDEESRDEEWRAPDGYNLVLANDCEFSEADKAFVFEAVNAHDELVAGLRAALDIIDGFEPESGGIASHEDISPIRSLLAKHGGAS